MPLQPNGLAPYASPATILSLLERARDRGLPAPVTKEVLSRSGVPESLQSRTLQALQLLELTNSDGTWTENLETLRRCPEIELQARLAEIIRSVYADIFQYVDPAKDGAIAVRDAFRSFTPHGQQDRMVSLFLGLCQRAGIISGDSKAKIPSQARDIRPQRKSFVQKPIVKLPSVNSRHMFSVGAGELAPPLAGLLATLPPPGSGWPQDDRDRFVQAFSTILDYCIPIRNQEPIPKNEEGLE